MKSLAVTTHARPIAMALVLIVLAGATLIGYASAVMPWFIPVALVVFPIALVIAALNPYFGLCLALAMLFEVIPSAFQPRLPFGGGSLRVYDLLLLYLMVALLSKKLTEKKASTLNILGPAIYPMLYLIAAFGVSMLNAKFIARNVDWLSEGRAAISWTLLPLIVLACDTPNKIKKFINGVVAMGLIIALYVSLQSLFDIRIMTEARVEMLDSRSNTDITRSITTGIYVIIFSLYLVINLMLARRLPILPSLLMAGLLLLGIAVQFGRGVWVACAIGLVISSYIHRAAGGVAKTLLLGGIALVVLISGLAIAKPRMAEALVERVMGISQEVESGGSFDWRKKENEAALDSISKRPLLGVGIGGEYKQTISSVGTFGIETRYIHNGYLYFPLKMGLLASLIPVTFILAFAVIVRRGLRQWAGQSDKGLIAAIAGAFAVPVVTSFTQPEWVAPTGIATYCVFISLALLYMRHGDVYISTENPKS